MVKLYLCTPLKKPWPTDLRRTELAKITRNCYSSEVKVGMQKHKGQDRYIMTKLHCKRIARADRLSDSITQSDNIPLYLLSYTLPR